MRRARSLGTLALIVIAGSASAQSGGFKSEFAQAYADIEMKFAQLAEATPWDKYAWKPHKDVRSVCEVFMHVALDNYLLGGAIGLQTPADMKGPTPEKCPADKAKVIATMKASFVAFKSALANLPESEMDAKFSLFGTSRTKRAWLLATAEHAGEHLGQSIAYARSNSIVPPWSK